MNTPSTPIQNTLLSKLSMLLLGGVLVWGAITPTNASAVEPSDEERLVALCDEVAVVVDEVGGDCAKLTDSFAAILEREKSFLEGKRQRGFRKRFPRATKHCEGLLAQKKRAKPLFSCLAYPRMLSLVAKADAISRAKPTASKSTAPTPVTKKSPKNK